MLEEYSFGRRLKFIRERRGISQKDLAAMLGDDFPANRISNYEIGVNRSAPVDTLRRLCVALGCTADELLGLEEPKLSADELWCLEHWRRLGPVRRKAVMTMIEHLEELRPAGPDDD